MFLCELQKSENKTSRVRYSRNNETSVKKDAFGAQRCAARRRQLYKPPPLVMKSVRNNLCSVGALISVLWLTGLLKPQMAIFPRFPHPGRESTLFADDRQDRKHRRLPIPSIVRRQAISPQEHRRAYPVEVGRQPSYKKRQAK
jgi:hypothetical protein